MVRRPGSGVGQGRSPRPDPKDLLARQLNPQIPDPDPAAAAAPNDHCVCQARTLGAGRTAAPGEETHPWIVCCLCPVPRDAAAGGRSIARGASNEERRETAKNPVVLENSDVPIAVIQICLVSQNAFCVAKPSPSMITHPKVYHLQLKVILNLMC